MERTFGWRHFVVKQRRRVGRVYWLLLEATCDSEVQFWINGANLKVR